MLFCSKRKRVFLKSRLKFILNINPLLFVTSTNNLGVYIHENLSFSNHVTELLSFGMTTLKWIQQTSKGTKDFKMYEMLTVDYDIWQWKYHSEIGTQVVIL